MFPKRDVRMAVKAWGSIGGLEMIRKSLYALAVATGAMAFASQADAATTFKFYADGGAALLPVAPNAGVSCTGDADRCGSTLTYTNGGITLDVTSSSDEAGAVVWQDIVPTYGGLGVGATGSTENVNPAVGQNDQLNLDFTPTPGVGPLEIQLSGLELYNHAGGAALPGSFRLGIDGGALTTLTFAAAAGMTFTGTTFEFKGFSAVPGGIGDGQKYYVSAFEATVVPIPAALPLFATALAGLGIFGWRKRKAGTA